MWSTSEVRLLLALDVRLCLAVPPACCSVRTTSTACLPLLATEALDAERALPPARSVVSCASSSSAAADWYPSSSNNLFVNVLRRGLVRGTVNAGVAVEAAPSRASSPCGGSRALESTISGVSDGIGANGAEPAIVGARMRRTRTGGTFGATDDEDEVVALRVRAGAPLPRVELRDILYEQSCH